MTKTEYIQNYVEPLRQRLAQVILPEGDRDKASWDQEWLRSLNKPAV